MSALCLSLILLVLFTAVGKATLSTLRYRRSALKAWLLAPSIGLCVVLFGLMIINQAGVPIRSFAWGWAAVLAAATGFVFYRQKPWAGISRLVPFALAALVFLLLGDWPALLYGLKWVSYGNDDMANYCLAAERFVERGFFTAPTAVEINVRDNSQTYWFMHGSDLVRFGSEHTLAWVSSLTGLKARYIFMPVIMTLACTQLFAAAALVLFKGRFRRWAVLAAWILAASPLFMLGALYQLIAQVGGLALLLTCISLLTEVTHARSMKALILEGFVIAIPAATLCIFYPEVTPFVVLTYGGFLLVKMVQDRAIPFSHIRRAIYVLAFVCLLLNHNLISYVFTLANQASTISLDVDLSLSLFPFFLIPTGVANLFGLMPLSVNFIEPFTSATIILGLVGVATTLITFLAGSRKGYPIALLGIMQTLLAVRLFQTGNDFGLYKLAMFIQPAIAGAGAWLIVSFTKKRHLQALWVLVYACLAFPSGHFYSSSSTGQQAGGLTELRYASAQGLDIKADMPKPAKILSTIDNVVGAKFAATELKGHDVAHASHDFFVPSYRMDYRRPSYILRQHPFFNELSKTPELSETHDRDYVGDGHLWRTFIKYPKLVGEPDYYLITSPRLSLFNKFELDPKTPVGDIFRLVPSKDIHNFVFFVHSGRGPHYYLGDRRRVALYQQERDPMQNDLDFAGIGPFMIMSIANPTEEIYLRVSATRTYSMPRSSWSTKARIQGDKDYLLGVSGPGAFNKIIGPIRPYWLNGAAYLALDFNEAPKTMKDNRSGLQALYSMNVPRDFRRIVGWGRDISALSPEQYLNLKRPTRVSKFPEDLARSQGLEFTGAYEDGWLSPVSEWMLGEAARGSMLHIKGQIPALGSLGSPKASMRIKINGDVGTILPAQAGDFDHLIPITHPGHRTEVQIEFDHTALLPNGDDRNVGALMTLMEIVPSTPKLWSIEPATSGHLFLRGVDSDGWAMNEVSAQLPVIDHDQTMVMRWDIPEWLSVTDNELTVTLQNQKPQVFTLKKGHTEISLAIPASEEVRTLHIVAARNCALPSPDTRQRAARLLSLELVSEQNAKVK